jgi:hypothetical protein
VLSLLHFFDNELLLMNAFAQLGASRMIFIALRVLYLLSLPLYPRQIFVATAIRLGPASGMLRGYFAC